MPMSTNIRAIRKLQSIAAYLVSLERTAAISKAEYIISDAILALWNDPSTNRGEYWLCR